MLVLFRNRKFSCWWTNTNKRPTPHQRTPRVARGKRTFAGGAVPTLYQRNAIVLVSGVVYKRPKTNVVRGIRPTGHPCTRPRTTRATPRDAACARLSQVLLTTPHLHAPYSCAAYRAGQAVVRDAGYTRADLVDFHSNPQTASKTCPRFVHNRCGRRTAHMSQR